MIKIHHNLRRTN